MMCSWQMQSFVVDCRVLSSSTAKRRLVVEETLAAGRMAMKHDVDASQVFLAAPSAIEAEIRANTREIRKAIRQARVAPLLNSMRIELKVTLANLSRKGSLAIGKAERKEGLLMSDHSIDKGRMDEALSDRGIVLGVGRE
jgi:hypothetical protein